MTGEIYRLHARVLHRLGLHVRQRHYGIAPRCDWCGRRNTKQRAIAKRNWDAQNAAQVSTPPEQATP